MTGNALPHRLPRKRNKPTKYIDMAGPRAGPSEKRQRCEKGSANEAKKGQPKTLAKTPSSNSNENVVRFLSLVLMPISFFYLFPFFSLVSMRRM